MYYWLGVFSLVCALILGVVGAGVKALYDAGEARQEYLSSTKAIWVCDEEWDFRVVENPRGLIFIPKPSFSHRCISPDGREDVKANYVRLTFKEIAEIPLTQRSS